MEQSNLFDETKILTNTSHNGYQRCLGLLENNPNTRDWRVLVELNAILNYGSAACWWYPYFLKEREEFMYESVKPSTLKVAELRSELGARGLPTTGKKAELVSNLTANMESSKDTTLKTVSGKGKKKTKRQLVADYKKLFPQRTGMGTSATVDEYINRCVGKIVEEKYKDIILEPNLDILRDFLEEHKDTINRLIRQIQPGHRSLLSWTELFSSPTVTTATHRLQGWGGVRIGGLIQDLSWEESKKFANPLYTLLSLSDIRLTPHLLLPWFLEELGLGGKVTYRDILRVQDTLNVNTNDRIRQNISDNSLKLTRVLLEYIELPVLNSRNCISPIVEIIRYANMKYPNNVLPNGNLYDEHNDQQTEDRITNIVNTATGMFELLVKFGLKDQGLTGLEFDVLGETWRRVNSQRGLEKVMRYTDPRDPHSQFTRAQRLSLLCHSNLRKYWIESYETFNRKKIVNVARGLEEENSPFSEMDYDTFRVLGETVKKSKVNRPHPTTLRRNTISQGRNQDLISAMQRLNTSRGLKSLTSPIGEGQGIDMELIEKIMNTQRDLNLIEDAKYSESRMGPEDYTEPPPPQFQIGDNIMWGDGLKGVVIGTPKGNLKILGDNMKRYILSNKTRNMKLIEREPEPFIDEIDGGGSKKKKRTKRKAKKKMTIRKGQVKGNNSAYFEFKSGSSRKFWRITKKGNKIITQYGKLGSLGQMTTKDYGSKVNQEYDKLIQSKKKKGYVEKMDFGDPNPKKSTNVEREYIKVCRKAEKSKVLNPRNKSLDCEGMLDQGESELKWMTQWHKDALKKGEYDWDKYNEHYKKKRLLRGGTQLETPQLIIRTSEEDNPELLSPPVSENARIKFKGMNDEEKIRSAFYSELAWGIPREHIDMFYIPILLSIPIDEEIEYEVNEYIKEKSLLGRERGIFKTPKQLLEMFLNMVSKEYEDDIYQRLEEEKERKQAEAQAADLEKHMEVLMELEKTMNVLIDNINDTMQECTSKGIYYEGCVKLHKLKKNKKDLEELILQIKENIRALF